MAHGLAGLTAKLLVLHDTVTAGFPDPAIGPLVEPMDPAVVSGQSSGALGTRQGRPDKAPPKKLIETVRNLNAHHYLEVREKNPRIRFPKGAKCLLNDAIVRLLRPTDVPIFMLRDEARNEVVVNLTKDYFFGGQKLAPGPNSTSRVHIRLNEVHPIPDAVIAVYVAEMLDGAALPLCSSCAEECQGRIDAAQRRSASL